MNAVDPTRKEFLTTQPGKAIWTLFAVATTAARLPFWLIYYLPSFLRPNPRWTYVQALKVRFLRLIVHHSSIVQVVTLQTLSPGAEKTRFVVAPVAPSTRYIGPAAPVHNINPKPVGGTWYPAAPPPSDEAAMYDTVVLHFHGGAFVIGDGRPTDTAFAAQTLLKHTPATRIYCPDYRLSSNPGGAFPAALQDAVTSLSYLLDICKLPANRIVLSGDSAGANLAAGLLRYLTTHGAAADLPSALKAAWFWSPWVDPSGSLDPTRTMDKSPNYPRDYLTAAFGTWGAKTLGSVHSEYVKHLGNPFAAETPIYISTGECEVLFDEDVRWAGEMRGVKGNRVELSVEEDAVHDVILTGKLVGFEREAERAARRAGQWLEGL